MSDWLMIGCPVYKRDWILPHWFKAIESQDFPLSKVGFTFLVAKDDEATVDVLFKFAGDHPELRCFDVVWDSNEDHLEHIDRGEERRRVWNRHRYGRMASMRNTLLERVICHGPSKYFSLDSDILLENPQTVSTLWDLNKPAVSPLCFMVPEDKDLMGAFPNIMSWVNDHRGRGCRLSYEYGDVFQADIIMAAVMMDQDTYTRSRYLPHPQGEDLGWSSECARLGIDLWSASNIYAPHIMYRKDLEHYLVKGDSRSRLVAA